LSVHNIVFSIFGLQMNI